MEHEALTQKIIGCAMKVHRIKAVRATAPAHETQLVNYLTATGIEIGLLLNFGADRLQFKRKTRTYRPPNSQQAGQDEQDDKMNKMDRIDRMR